MQPEKLATVSGKISRGQSKDWFHIQCVVAQAEGFLSVYMGPEQVLSKEVVDWGAGVNAWRFSSQGVCDMSIDHFVVSAAFFGELALGDMDGDSLSIGWEAAQGYDWGVPNDIFVDEDGDGRVLFEEYILGTSDQEANEEAPQYGWLDQYYYDTSFAGLASLSFPSFLSPSRVSYFQEDFQYFEGFNLEERSNRFGRRLRGYLTPEESGYYTFWSIFDHDSEVRISLTGKPEDSELITFTQGWNKRWLWEEYPGQKSLPIYLAAGEAYFVDVAIQGLKENEFMGLKWAHEDWETAKLIPAALVRPFERLADDLDDDGLPDAWEVAHGLNPLSPWGDAGAWGDPDGDGIFNEREHAFGFDPQVPDVSQVPERSSVFNVDGRTVTDDVSPWVATTVGASAEGEAFGLDDGFAIIAEGGAYALDQTRAYQGRVNDGYHFLSQPVVSAFELTARVDMEFLQHTGSFAGLSLVSELEAKGRRASVFMAGDGRVVTATRTLLNKSAWGQDPLQAGLSGPSAKTAQAWLLGCAWSGATGWPRFTALSMALNGPSMNRVSFLRARRLEWVCLLLRHVPSPM